LPDGWRKRLFDVLATAPLLLLYALAVFGVAPQIWAELDRGVFAPRGTMLWAINLALQLATILFYGLMVGIFFTRRLPIMRSENNLERAVAIAAASMNFLIALLPHARMDAFWSFESIIVLLIGTAGIVYVLSYLRGGFSVFPQARRFVSTGPYRFIRHPLYLAEGISMLGVIPQFEQPWALLVAASAFALQFPRMGFEEEILAKAYPEYRDYMKRTAKLIPGVY
jgi:protein-S-isoprenylcysteine O-methyltransferase Ste14